MNSLLFAQNTNELQPLQHSQDWVGYSKNEKFIVEYKFSDCDPSIGFDQEKVILKVTNLTGNKIKLSWYIHIYYEGKCVTCENYNEHFKEVYLIPGEVIEGQCDGGYVHNELQIFSKFIDANYRKGTFLSNFELFDLKCTEILNK